MKHPRSTCPSEPSVILALFLLPLALVACVWWHKRDRRGYRNGDRMVMVT